jgi:ribosomal protein S12 methylthiotransferase accessory factor
MPAGMNPPRLLPLAAGALHAAGERAGVPPPLLALLPRFSRLFGLISADAPGLACFGGELALSPDEREVLGRRSLSVTGAGFDPAAALASLLGEAADLLSPLERAGDLFNDGGLPLVDHGWIGPLLAQAAAPLDWMRGFDVATGANVCVPADLALRRKPSRRRLEVGHALSSGVAAGASVAEALERAVLELIERDAAVRWWRDGGPAHALPEGGKLAARFAEKLARLRGALGGRPTMALFLPGVTCVPVAVAVSRAADGTAVAFGLAARRNAADALDAALREMAQMEMSIPVALLKAGEAGAASLAASDRRHLRRAFPGASFVDRLRPSDVREPEDLASDLRAHVAARGLVLTAVNLTRPDIGVPVMRALSGDLKPFVFEDDDVSPY